MITVMMDILVLVVYLFVIASIYSAQKWAYKCYKELRKLNSTMKNIETSLTYGKRDNE